MFTVAIAGCESYATNDATLAGSELDVQSRVGQHGCVGVEGPRNGSAVALTVAKHGFWAVTGAGNGRVGRMAKTATTWRCVV